MKSLSYPSLNRYLITLNVSDLESSANRRAGSWPRDMIWPIGEQIGVMGQQEELLAVFCLLHFLLSFIFHCSDLSFVENIQETIWRRRIRQAGTFCYWRVGEFSEWVLILCKPSQTVLWFTNGDIFFVSEILNWKP